MLPLRCPRPEPLSSGLKALLAYLNCALIGIILSFERWSHCQLIHAGGQIVWRMVGWQGSWLRLNLFWSIKLPRAPDVQAQLLILITVRRIKIWVANVFACTCQKDLGSRHICKQTQRNFKADLTALSVLLCSNNCLQAARPLFPWKF